MHREPLQLWTLLDMYSQCIVQMGYAVVSQSYDMISSGKYAWMYSYEIESDAR